MDIIPTDSNLDKGESVEDSLLDDEEVFSDELDEISSDEEEKSEEDLYFAIKEEDDEEDSFEKEKISRRELL
jgi:hypothetical protein